MPDIMSAVDIAAEFRDELARLDAAAVDVMLGQWRQVEAALIDDMEAFAARFEPGETLTPGQVLRMQRYQALQAQVTAQLAALEGAAGPLITAGQTQAAGLGALQAATTLDALEVGISFNQLSTKATQNIVALARAGKPLSDLLAPMYGAASDGIIRELINGVALGYGPRKIARNMARDGMTDALNHLLLVSRDQYNRAARTAAFQRYEDSGVVRGYTRRCARQAGRTCIACIALDGEFYPLSVPFAEHPQGRCVPIPAIKGVEVRSRLGSGKSWFEGLDDDAQIATMGRGRWEAWKAGELPWDKMAVRTNHPVWGPGVRVANVPDGFKKVKAAKATAIKITTEPIGEPVSAAMWMQRLPAGMRAEAQRTLDAIDRVHGDGQLPVIDLIPSRMKVFGKYEYYNSGKVEGIKLNTSNDNHGFTLAHEVGHFLDHQTIGRRGWFATEDKGPRFRDDPDLADAFGAWEKAVKDSKAYKSIRALPGGYEFIEDGITYSISKSSINYYLGADELWARSYAQFIAVESGDSVLTESLERHLSDAEVTGIQKQWAGDDFEPIRDAMRNLFRVKGWMR